MTHQLTARRDLARAFTVARRLLGLIALLGPAVGMLFAPVMAQSPQPQLTAADLRGFIDGHISLAMKRDDIAGMEVAVVKDGEVLLLQGYGASDRTRGTPVDPRRTLFRVGSVSKTFTAMAVMRLVERGQLDLDRDVNTYLDFKIEPAFGQPVTLRQLLTHTAGFEDTMKGLYAPNRAGIVPLGTYLKEHQPKRVFPPGKVAAYSNYGFALAGHIVERASGMPYAVFMDREILSKMGMKNSSFAQPPPLGSDASLAAAYSGSSVLAEPFEYLQIPPAGSLSTTAEDMSLFMLSQLKGGEVTGGSVLRPETIDALHARQFDRGSRVGGVALAWAETSLHGRRVLAHGGATLQYLAYVALVPDEHLGVYFVQSGTNREVGPALVEALMDRYFPDSSAARPNASPVGEIDPGVAGVYETVRRNESSIGRLFAYLRQSTVAVAGRGVITISTLRGSDNETVRWLRIAPFVYRDAAGDDVVQFRTDQRGRVMSFIGPNLHVGEFQKTPMWRHAKPLAVLLLVAAAILMVFVLNRTARVASRMMKQNLARRLTLLDWALMVSAVCALVVVAVWPSVLIDARIHLDRFDSHLDLTLRLLQGLGIAAALGVPLAVVNVLLAQRCNVGGPVDVLLTVLTVAALAVFTWIALLFNVFSLSLRF